MKTENGQNGNTAVINGTSCASNGKIYIIISALLLSVMGFMIRYMTGPMDIDVMTVVFFRSIISAAVIFVFTWARSEPVLGVNRKMLLLRGVTGSAGMILLFISISKTDLANAMTLFYTFPVFSVLLAKFVAKERPGRAGFLILLSFAGVFLIVRPKFGTYDIGEICGLGSALFAGMAIFLVRDLRKTDTPFNIAKYLALTGTAVTLPFAFKDNTWMTYPGILMLCALGAISTAAQFYMTTGYRYCTNAQGGALSYISIPVSALIALVFFAEFPGIAEMAGMILVIVSGIMLFMSRE